MTIRLLLVKTPIILAIVLLSLQAAWAGPATLSGAVVRVYDGDTIEVAQLGKVRLIGIDAPEFKASRRDRFYLRRNISAATLRRVARRARAFLVDKAQGRQVDLTTDHTRRDRYGRLLAYVRLPDGRLLNRLLVEAGLASVYRRFDFRLKADFLAAESEAQRAGRGMWGK